jgi:hypothetical protein
MIKKLVTSALIIFVFLIQNIILCPLASFAQETENITFQKMSIPALIVHPSCLLNPYEKRPLSILSTQPYLFLAQISLKKYPPDMFPCTYFASLG